MTVVLFFSGGIGDIAVHASITEVAVRSQLLRLAVANCYSTTMYVYRTMSLMEEEDAITDVSEDAILGAYFLRFSANYACVQVLL